MNLDDLQKSVAASPQMVCGPDGCKPRTKAKTLEFSPKYMPRATDYQKEPDKYQLMAIGSAQASSGLNDQHFLYASRRVLAMLNVPGDPSQSVGHARLTVAFWKEANQQDKALASEGWVEPLDDEETEWMNAPLGERK